MCAVRNPDTPYLPGLSSARVCWLHLERRQAVYGVQRVTGTKRIVAPKRGWSRATPMEIRGVIPPCPQQAGHTPTPMGYLPWHEWAERKSKTHQAVRCSGCDLYAIWIPKESVA